jgi:hypothetical protein
MDKFLNTVIIIFLINIILVYLYQNLIKTEENSINEKNNVKQTNINNQILKENISCQKDWVKTHNFNKDRVLGPVYNFHQTFNDKLNNPKLRELGWRKYYLRNYNKSLDKNSNVFKNTVMDNYLSNLESNRNVYLE